MVVLTFISIAFKTIRNVFALGVFGFVKCVYNGFSLYRSSPPSVVAFKWRRGNGQNAKYWEFFYYSTSSYSITNSPMSQWKRKRISFRAKKRKHKYIRSFFIETYVHPWNVLEADFECLTVARMDKEIRKHASASHPLK